MKTLEYPCVSLSLLSLTLVFRVNKMPALQATVKSVLSGDTVTLVNAKGAERSLSLAYVSAPRLKRDGDEVCSHRESREGLG